MRAGLVVTGIAVALVGGALIASVFVAQVAPSAPNNFSSHSDSAMVPTGTTYQLEYNLTATESGNLTLNWSSSSPASVSLWPEAACPTGAGLCLRTAPLASWSFNSSGRWWMTGAINERYFVSVADPGSTVLGFNDTLSENFTGASTGAAAPMWEHTLSLAGGGILLTIGGIALFLGLFLPGNVYRRPPAEPPTFPTEDFEAIPDPETP